MGEGILPDGNLPGGEGRFQPLLYNKMGTGEGRFQMNEQLFLAYRNNGQPPLSLLYPSPILLMSRVGDGWTPCFLSLLPHYFKGRG